MVISTGLAKTGAKIIVNSTSAEKLNNAQKEYQSKGIDATTCLFDVSKEYHVIDSIGVKLKKK